MSEKIKSWWSSIDWSMAQQKIIGTVTALIMFLPLTFVFAFSILGGVISFFGFNSVQATVAFLVIFAVCIVFGYILSESKLQSALFGALLALLIFSVLFIVTGLVGVAVSFLFGAWQSLLAFILLIIVVLLSIGSNGLVYSALWKIGD
jgi:hypothetical protein